MVDQRSSDELPESEWTFGSLTDAYSSLHRLSDIVRKLLESEYRDDYSSPNILLFDFDILRSAFPSDPARKASDDAGDAIQQSIHYPRRLRLLLGTREPYSLPIGTLQEVSREISSLSGRVVSRKTELSAIRESLRSRGGRRTPWHEIVRRLGPRPGHRIAELVDSLTEEYSVLTSLHQVIVQSAHVPIENLFAKDDDIAGDQAFNDALAQLDLRRPDRTENNLADALNIACCASVTTHAFQAYQRTSRFDADHPLPVLITNTDAVRSIQVLSHVPRQLRVLVPELEKVDSLSFGGLYFVVRELLSRRFEGRPQLRVAWLRRFLRSAAVCDRSFSAIANAVGAKSIRSNRRGIPAARLQPYLVRRFRESMERAWDSLLRVVEAETSLETTLQEQQLRGVVSKKALSALDHGQPDQLIDDIRSLLARVTGNPRLVAARDLIECSPPEYAFGVAEVPEAKILFRLKKQRISPTLDHAVRLGSPGNDPMVGGPSDFRQTALFKGTRRPFVAMDVEFPDAGAAEVPTKRLTCTWEHHEGNPRETAVLALETVSHLQKVAKVPGDLGCEIYLGAERRKFNLREVPFENVLDFAGSNADITYVRSWCGPVGFFADVKPFDRDIPELQVAFRLPEQLLTEVTMQFLGDLIKRSSGAPLKVSVVLGLLQWLREEVR